MKIITHDLNHDLIYINYTNISMAIQKGNAHCVTGCVKDKSSGLEGLFNFQVHEAEEL